jgi:hypothetical protein
MSVSKGLTRQPLSQLGKQAIDLRGAETDTGLAICQPGEVLGEEVETRPLIAVSLSGAFMGTYGSTLMRFGAGRSERPSCPV